MDCNVFSRGGNINSNKLLPFKEPFLSKVKYYKIRNNLNTYLWKLTLATFLMFAFAGVIFNAYGMLKSILDILTFLCYSTSQFIQKIVA